MNTRNFAVANVIAQHHIGFYSPAITTVEIIIIVIFICSTSGA